MKLVPIPPPDYVRDVLPHSESLWAKGRTFERYAADFESVAASGYGRRRFRTLGLRIDGHLVASLKRYEREIGCGDSTLRACGIGAVFTQPEFRGRGYATAMLGAFLDAERAAGTDIAFLFSDIHPAFYERLGFVTLPSRLLALRTSSLPSLRIDSQTVGDADWAGVRRCFEMQERRRTFWMRRTPLVWEWMRLRLALPEEPNVQFVHLACRRGRSIVAYIMGRRAPRLDTFVLDEFAYADEEARALVPPLARNAAGDLAKIGGWLPPDTAREALPAGAVRARKNGITMFAPLSRAARAAWKAGSKDILAQRGDPVWSTDRI